jgi:hypothetical protein
VRVRRVVVFDGVFAAAVLRAAGLRAVVRRAVVLRAAGLRAGVAFGAVSVPVAVSAWVVVF